MSPQNLVSYSGLTSNQPTLRRNKCSCLKGHRSADFTEVHPDRTPLVGRQPLIGQWWCHHPKECVKGLSCSGDRGFVSFPCSHPLTSSPFSTYIYIQPQGCLLTSESLHYECLFNPVLYCDLASLWFNYGHTVWIKSCFLIVCLYTLPDKDIYSPISTFIELILTPLFPLQLR